MSQKLPYNQTVEKWIAKYPALQFDGNILRCNACDIVLSWNRKSHIVQHVATERHKARVSGNVSGREKQKQFNVDLVQMMVTCNIAWDKLGNPVFRQFLENCISGKYNGISVPGESTLRKHYLPQTCDEIKTEIISELQEKNVWISVDETTDSSRRNIAHVIVGGMHETIPMRAHLISSKVLDTTNAQTISECVDMSLKQIWGKNIENNKGRFLLYITNEATYMKISGELLKNTYNYVNLLHVTCLAQGLHQIAETVRECYPTIDKIIATVQKMFLKTPSMQKIFVERLPGIPLPPEPIVTRWGTWLEAASYYYIHYDHVKSILEQLSAGDAQTIADQFRDSRVREDLTYIHGNFSRIYLAIRSLECAHTSTGYSILSALNIIFDLRNFIYQLSQPPAEHVKNKFELVFQNNPGFRTMCSIVDLFMGKEVDLAQPDINTFSLKNFTYFKYVPLTSADVERSLSSLKWIFTDKRQRLTCEHLEQLLLIYFNSQVD